MLTIHRQVLTPEEQAVFLNMGLQMYDSMKKVPHWLGEFSFKTYYKYSWKRTALAPVVEKLATFAPHQKFNTVFLQVYASGAIVKEHRDPRNNVGETIIGIAGDFTGANTYVNGQLAGQLLPGDVGVLPCTINGVQGPRHNVTRVLTGYRVALILNTVEG